MLIIVFSFRGFIECDALFCLQEYQCTTTDLQDKDYTTRSISCKGFGRTKGCVDSPLFEFQVNQTIDIIVVDIPKAYGVILSRDWSAKLNGYFATD